MFSPHFLCSKPSSVATIVLRMARHERFHAREDDFLSESDLSTSHSEGSERVATSEAYHHKPYPARRLARHKSQTQGDVDSSGLSSSSDDSDEEDDEEKLIESAPGSDKAHSSTKRDDARDRCGKKRSKKTRRVWEMRSGDGAPAAAAQSVSSSLLPFCCRCSTDSFRLRSLATRVLSSVLSSSSCSWQSVQAGASAAR